MAGRPRRHDIYNRLDEAFDELRTRMGGLPNPVEAEGIWTTIWFEEAHHSTAIEGNTGAQAGRAAARRRRRGWR